MHMYVLQSLDRDDLLYMSTCHHSRTLSLLPDVRLNSVTTGLFLAFLAFSDLENIYLFFINQNYYPWKNLIRYSGACQGVANGNQGQNGSVVLDLIRSAAFFGRSYFKELDTGEFSALS